MGAAAELLRRPDADDAHDVAVLLAEDHDGAGLARVAELQHRGLGLRVLADDLVVVAQQHDGIHQQIVKIARVVGDDFQAP